MPPKGKGSRGHLGSRLPRQFDRKPHHQLNLRIQSRPQQQNRDGGNWTKSSMPRQETCCNFHHLSLVFIKSRAIIDQLLEFFLQILHVLWHIDRIMWDLEEALYIYTCENSQSIRATGLRRPCDIRTNIVLHFCECRTNVGRIVCELATWLRLVCEFWAINSQISCKPVATKKRNLRVVAKSVKIHIFLQFSSQINRKMSQLCEIRA